MSRKLPRAAEWIVRRLLPAWAVEDMIGDLTELYTEYRSNRGPLRATLWLWGHVIMLRVTYARHFASTPREAPKKAHAGMFNDLRLDLRQAARSLLRSRDYTVVAVLALGVGIGASTAVYTVARNVLVRPLPFAEEDRVVVIKHRAPLAPVPDQALSFPEIDDYRGDVTSLSAVASYSVAFGTVLGLGEPDRIFVASVSQEYFDVLGVRPIAGRTFTGADGGASVVLLSYEYWMDRLGSDPDMLGRSIRLDDRPYEVIGVLPPLPRYPNEAALFVPAASQPMFARFSTVRNARMMTAIGRLTDDAVLETANREVAQTAEGFVAEFPDQYVADQGLTAALSPIRTEMVGGASSTIGILAATAALVLLLVCINVANMTMARLARRDDQMALRIALGASQQRIARYHMAEGVLLASAGWIVGIGLAWASLGLLARWAARTTPHVADATLDGAVLAFGAGVALFAGVIAAGVPALRAVRHAHVFGRLGTERSSAARGWLRLQHALLVGQVGVSLVLVVTAALFGRSLLALQRVDYGFRSSQVLSMRVALNRSYRGPQSERSFVFYDELLQRLGGLPDVAGAAIGRDVPLSGGPTRTAAIDITGRKDQTPAVGDLRVVSPEYFPTLGLTLVEGRNFDTRDDTDAPGVAIVNASLASRYWPDESPLGRTFIPARAEDPVTVIGVVSDVRHYGLDAEPVPEYYLPLRQFPLFGWYLFVRSRPGVAPLALTRQVTDLVHELDPTLPVHQVRTLEDVLGAGIAPPAFRAQLVGLFGVLALIVTCVGVFGLTAFAVGTRMRELGIRMALGADARRVMMAVLRRTLGFTALGLGIGIVGAIALQRLVEGLLFQISALDPLNLAAACGLVLASAFAAAVIPARRATQVDPMVVFRE